MSDYVTPPPEPEEDDEKLAMERRTLSSNADHPDGTDPDRVPQDLDDLADLVAAGMEVDGQVLQVAESTWAIHGHSSYDGAIIVGEYPDAGEASEVLHAAPHREPDRDEPVP